MSQRKKKQTTLVLLSIILRNVANIFKDKLLADMLEVESISHLNHLDILTLTHHETTRENDVRFIHNHLMLVLLEIQHRLTLLSDEPTTFLQYVFGHSDVVSSSVTAP